MSNKGNVLRPLQRCTALDSKGRPCGQYAMKGTLFCVTHTPGKPLFGVTGNQPPRAQRYEKPPDGLDDYQLLTWYTRHNASPDQLRALMLKIELDRQARASTCSTCEERQEAIEREAAFRRTLSMDEIATLQKVYADARVPVDQFRDAILAENRKPVSHEAFDAARQAHYDEERDRRLAKTPEQLIEGWKKQYPESFPLENAQEEETDAQ
jgi:hypothetical protein